MKKGIIDQINIIHIKTEHLIYPGVDVLAFMAIWVHYIGQHIS